jgi:hypothetical protein
MLEKAARFGVELRKLPEKRPGDHAWVIRFEWDQKDED